MTNGLRCMLMRGGSSKGAYFVADDLPDDPDERDDLLRRVMGSPDPRQIDGVGGAHPLTSKVAIVSPASDDRADIDYLFLQVWVDDSGVSDRQNCGNLLAGVGPFAMERGLVDADSSGTTSVRILMRNTDTVATATFTTTDDQPIYHGDTAISGVPGTAAEIRLEFDDLAGGSCGSLLPTGAPVTEIDGVRCILIDNGMPAVVMQAAQLGISGYESCEDLEANADLRAHLERIRIEAGHVMNLGDVSDTTIPKMTMVAAPQNGGHLSTRTFIPHRCHEAIGVLGAVSVATTALLEGSPANELLADPTTALPPNTIRLEHPTGFFDAVVATETDSQGATAVTQAGIVRTARKLMDGTVFPRPAESRNQ